MSFPSFTKQHTLGTTTTPVCSVKNNCASNTKVYESSACIDSTQEDFKKSRLCTTAYTADCGELITTSAEFVGTAEDDLTLQCNLQKSQFLLTGSVNDSVPIANIETYMGLKGYNSFGNNEYQNLNLTEFYREILPTSCLFTTNIKCLPDFEGKPMNFCTYIHQDSDFGRICQNWYKYSDQQAEVDAGIDKICSQGGSTYPEDCECNRRYEDGDFSKVNATLNGVIPAACFWKPCLPSSNTLKKELERNPVCPSNVCVQVVNIVNSDPNINLDQRMNCSESSVASEAANMASITTILTLMLVFFVIYFIILLFATGG